MVMCRCRLTRVQQFDGKGKSYQFPDLTEQDEGIIIEFQPSTNPTLMQNINT